MGSRSFGKKEIDALSSRIRLAQGLGNNGISMVEKTRSDIESAIGEAIKPEWARVLRGIPVDELNAGKAGIRTNVLKEAGYGDIYSVYAASQQNLAAVNGIGEVMSLRAKENAAKIASDVNSNVKLKISVDHKTEEYSRLVTAVAEYMRARENLPKCEQLLSMIPSDTEEQLKKLSCARSGIKWMFTGGKKKDEAQTAYDSLTATASVIDSTGLVSQIQGYQGATGSAEASASSSQTETPSSLSSIIGPISIAAAWNDFARRPIEYYQVLEEIAPERFDSDEDGYGLSDEIREDVANTPVDLTGLKCTLRGYQIWGVKYILRQKRVLLGDEMGLGKTIQALAAMVSLRNELTKEPEEASAPVESAPAESQPAPAPVSPLQDDSDIVLSALSHPPRFLVICPASVIVNWCREVEGKSDLVAYNLHDNNRDTSFRTWTEEGGVAVTNYESLENHFKIDEDFEIDMIVVDEAHYIKNTAAKRSQNVLSLCEHTDRMLFMTGTPLENNVGEMIHLMDYLQHDVAQLAQQVSMTAYADDFKEKICPVYYRRKRESVLSELPDLTDVKEWCDMTPEDERAYEDDVLTGSFMDVRRVSWRNEDYLNTSAKVQRLREIVEDAAEDSRKILVFSFFLDTLEKIRTVFGTQCVGVINGAVPVEERQNIVDAFEAAPAGSVLAAQIQSGGTGLNIQSASVVILCEPQYKPSTENQAIGRAHRMGQTRDVLVYRLLCPDTVDERMIEIIEAKQAEFDTFADESNAAAKDAESEKSGVDVNEGVIVGEKEEPAEQASSDASQAAPAESTAASPATHSTPAESSEAPEREIDNASINKIFESEKARILAKREREAREGKTAAPAPAAAPEPQKLFCRFCGRQIPADAIFCNYCGKDIR
ncbi:MAG: DEAD/DEAH box helicase family protein [Clostridiales bacterium]|nr:DEAD/DEAH box helicase family protein [Clostridiales bacterium]